MSKESLEQAVTLAGGQAQLGRGIRERIPGSKVGQVHVWGWLKEAKFEVPPAEVVLAIADFLEYRMTPHQLRPDLYPHPMDGLPPSMRSGCECKDTPPEPEVRARACPDRREDDRRATDAPFGEFGERRGTDRREDDRRAAGCSEVKSA